MAPEAHAKLSISGIKQWGPGGCQASIKLTEDIPDVQTSFSAAGTVAHRIAECKLLLWQTNDDRYLEELNRAREDPSYERKMEEATDLYVDHVIATFNSYDDEPFIAFEQRLSAIRWIPEGFGTADCIMVAGNDLHVFDYKNGSGVQVHAEENPQLSMYALCAWNAYRDFYPEINSVTLHIVQPHAGGVSTWTTELDPLLLWGEKVKIAAKQAFLGVGKPNPGEETCRWCKIKGTCRARLCWLVKAMASDEWIEDKPELDNDEIGNLLGIAAPVVEWYSSLKETAESKLMNGQRVKGYKLVAGRTTRAWKDQKKAFEAIVGSGIDEAMCYERTPLIVAKMEKVLGKKGMAQFDDFVVKNPGKPTMVVESDKREAINPGADKLDFILK